MPEGHASGGVADMLERDSEQRAIRAAVAAATTGDGAVLLVEGPAGIGKSALLEHAAEVAGSQMTRATARGAELERGFAHGLVLQLLAPLLPARGDAAFGGAAAVARPLFERGEAQVSLDADLPLLHALHWLCAALADEQPLLLLLDDLQWADQASLRFLSYLAGRVAGLPLLVVGAVRSGEAGADEELLDALRDGASTTVLRPAPLSETGVAALVSAAAPGPTDSDVAAACWRLTGGNPLFVEELIRAAADEDGAALRTGDLESLVPESVVRLVDRRLRRQPGRARDVAQALAVLGDRARPGELGHVTGLESEAVLEALDALSAAELTLAAAPTRFRHPLLRQAAHEGTPPGERLRLHAAAAEALRRSDPGRSATHLLAADGVGKPPDWAASVLRAAAADARARGGGQEAVRYLAHALTLSPPPQDRRALLLELGTIQAELRDFEALDHLAQAAALAPDPVEHAQITLRHAEALFYFAQLERCSEVCREAVAQLGEAEPDRELRLALEAAALSADALLGVRRERPRELAHEVVAASTPGERAVAAHVLADLAATGAEPAGVLVERGRRVLGDGALLREAGPASPLTIYAGTALAWAGDHRSVLELTTQGLALGHERGSLMAITYALALRAGTHRLRGDLAQAESDAALVVDEFPVADPMAFAISLAWLIEVRIERGQPAEARDALDRSGLTGDLPDLGTIDFLMLARGALYAAEGELGAAREEYAEVGRRATRSSYLNPAAMDWRSRLGLVLLELGEPAEATELLDEELERAEAFGAPRAVGVALRARAAAAPTDEAVDLLRRSVDTLANADARLEHARALVDLGAAQHRAGDEAARDTLAEGMDLAHRVDATVLRDRAIDELRATGARPRRPRVRGADALTPQERRVARLAAAGASNPQIAEELFLTRRTVEMHLSNAYRKLGIDSRGGLEDALGMPA